MNIFVLNSNPKIAAQMHLDKHVTKMSVEYAQLLSTAHHLLTDKRDPELVHLYKPTHKNHPATKWVVQHPAHYAWLYDLAEATWAEYTYRYGKVHASSRLRPWLSKVPRQLVAFGAPTPPPQCMPENYRVHPISWDNTVMAYQQYYRGPKAAFATWTQREVPAWFYGEEPNGGKLP